MPGRLTLSEQGTVVGAVLDGIGLAYVLEDTARPYIESGQMVAVLEDWSEPFAGFALYYPADARRVARVRGYAGGSVLWFASTHGVDLLPNDSLHALRSGSVVPRHAWIGVCGAAGAFIRPARRAFATELDQAEAVPERIGQHGDTAQRRSRTGCSSIAPAATARINAASMSSTTQSRCSGVQWRS